MFDVNAETGEIYLYDVIGPGWLGMIDAGTVIEGLNRISASKRVTIRINSPGGNVDEAIAIYNALERHPGGVDVAVDSLAASAGSYIAMVGQNIQIADGGAFMLHNPLTSAWGNAAELRTVADMLDKYRDRIIGAYESRLKISREEVQAILDAETWYTASEAVTAGLADGIGNFATAEPAMLAVGMYKNIPTRLIRTPEAGSRTPYPINRMQAEARRRRFCTQ